MNNFDIFLLSLHKTFISLDYVEKMGVITNQIGEERAREKQREVGNMLLERIDAMLSRSRDSPSSSSEARSLEKQLEKRKSAVSKFVANPSTP